MQTDTYVHRIPRQPDTHWALSAEERLREIVRETLAENKRLRVKIEKMEKRGK
jgi:hypothetical protein